MGRSTFWSEVVNEGVDVEGWRISPFYVAEHQIENTIVPKNVVRIELFGVVWSAIHVM